MLTGLYPIYLGEGNGTPLQYSCLENPMDGGAWQAAVHGVAEGRTWLSTQTKYTNTHTPRANISHSTHKPYTRLIHKLTDSYIPTTHIPTTHTDTHTSDKLYVSHSTHKHTTLHTAHTQTHWLANTQTCTQIHTFTPHTLHIYKHKTPANHDTHTHTSSVQSVMSDSWLPCPSPTPRTYSNSCPLSRWCHPTISSSVVPFSSSLQSFPASGSFPMTQFFASGGQSIGVSASATVLPMNIQGWFPLWWTCWISLQSKGLSRVFSNTTVQKHKFFGAQLSL